MRVRKNLTGRVFGNWVVLSFSHSTKHGDQYWVCKCKCDTIKPVNGGSLKSGKSTNCGCERKLKLIGNTFGRLKVVDYDGLNKHKHTLWRCKCGCGNEVIVEGAGLTIGHTQSCGCFHSQRISETHRGKKGLLGKDNGNWNPDRTHEQRVKERKLLENTVWRNDVFERDNYMCCYCGDATGGNLVAHHIESYMDNVNLRTDVNNGICLCESCHKEFHGIFGYGHNTREQLCQFLKGGHNVGKIFV